LLCGALAPYYLRESNIYKFNNILFGVSSLFDNKFNNILFGVSSLFDNKFTSAKNLIDAI
jgi:hypothetical protein